jgi:purine-cytosine permease-like protein
MSWSGIILVIAGALLLASNFGLLQWGWLYQWWPVFLIALGVWSILRSNRGTRRTERRERKSESERGAGTLP